MDFSTTNRFLPALAFTVAMLVAACGDDPDATDASPIDESENVADTTTSNGAPATTTPDETDQPTGADSPAGSTTTTEPPDSAEPPQVSETDLARFVAAAEAALVDTPNSGTVIADPDTYIVLGQVACARLSDNETFDNIADDLTDDAGISGAVIGAAVGTICQEHTAKL